jgi:hypothetical protein
MTFCTDLDLLHWEPTLFKDASFVSQTLLSTTADLDGTILTLPDGLVGSADEIEGEVVYIGGSVDGCFPIASIDSATQLTISVLYDKLFDETPQPRRVAGGASGVVATIRTFWPQRKIVSDLMLGLLDVPIDKPQRVLNPVALRRACVLGTLQMIYAAISATSEDASAARVRADLYERLYRRALRSARIELDLDDDGEADCRRTLASLKLVRS